MLRYLMPYKKDGFFPRSLVSVLGVDGDRLGGGRGGGGGGGGEAPAAGGRGEGVWQLRPAPQQRVRAVNLPRSSQLSHVQVEIIPVTTLSKQT